MVLKWATDINNHFSKEVIQVAMVRWKIVQHQYSWRKIVLKTTGRYHRWLLPRQQQNPPHSGEDVRKGSPRTVLVAKWPTQPLWTTHGAPTNQRTINRTTCDPVVWPWAYVQKKSHVEEISTLHTTEAVWPTAWHQRGHPSIDQWIRRTWNTRLTVE